MTQPIQKLVIVGGGTAGWLTAGIIAARHQGRMKAGFSVTLVESPNIPIIGVGEGTWPTLRGQLNGSLPPRPASAWSLSTNVFSEIRTMQRPDWIRWQNSVA